MHTFSPFVDYETLPSIAVPQYPALYKTTETAQLMLREVRPLFIGSLSTSVDSSFIGQLGKLITEDGTPRKDVEAIGFCLESSVPVADAVRAVYAELGETPPMFFGLPVRRTTVRQYELNPELYDKAVAQVEATLDGRTKVVFLDQLVSTGRTVAAAKRMLAQAGCDDIGSILGMWYSDGSNLDIRTDTFTSSIAPKMQEIGMKSVTSFLEAHATALS